MSFSDSLYQLIVQTSTNLPSDIRRLIAEANKQETPNTNSALALATIALNVDMACDSERPICQDTGMPTFIISTPVGFDQIALEEQIRECVAKATKAGKLRPNSVDSLTGKNSGDNLGAGTPVVHFHQHRKDEVEIKLLLKGGGCENKNIQYSLPQELPGLGRADRDLDGVRKCLMHAVYQAQGQGCSAGYLGVCIGGDRTSGYEGAKMQLFRKADDVNPVPELAELEKYVTENGNKLGIGTMGFGGRVTLLGCKIGAMNRLPASFFVSVAYDCWAFRRLGVVLDPQSGEIRRWLYREQDEIKKLAVGKGFQLTGREVVLEAPITDEKIRSVKAGDIVVVNGLLHTGRDALHHYLLHNDSPVDMHGQVLYHCGPVMIKDKAGKWQVTGAGPTTSMREEPYEADIIGRFGIRAVIGKGGMGAKTLKGLQQHGAVYLNAIGGAAQVYAENIVGVEGVDLLDELGVPEAMWHLRVNGFATICTMDSHGHSLHREIDQASLAELGKFAEPVYSGH
ncbi:MAG TPA: FumA C-terminus/TtdB family hydratase beta subunit [Planctomycetaceae bacterium]|jgi:fumarate hydratase class I